MKINLTEELLAGKSNNYKKDQADQAPQLIRDLFTIEGVKGVYHVADFLAVERNAIYLGPNPSSFRGKNRRTNSTNGIK
jgi:hypothetical protein